jgi:cytochrome d ubiquinol oxidase subunit I
VLVAMTFAGWVATLAGWYVTEIGRQPFLVYDVLLTRDAASAVPAPLIGLSLSMYLCLYALLMSAYVSVVFHLARKAGMPGDPLPARPSRPPLGGMAGA